MEDIYTRFKEPGRRLFAGGATFMRGVPSLEHLPPQQGLEIAFAGRSNVGKSSLLNALCGHAIARTSNTPGRTQELNFFNVANRLVLVDMPGYGYAKESKSKITAWNKLMKTYLRGRVNLRRVFVLVDSRHGLKDNDTEMFKMLDEAAVTYQIILTKADKISLSEQQAVVAATEQHLKKYPAAFPRLILTSSNKGGGIENLRSEIAALLEGH